MSEYPLICGLCSIIPTNHPRADAFFLYAYHGWHEEIDVILQNVIELIENALLPRIIKSRISHHMSDIGVILLLNARMVIFHVRTGTGHLNPLSIAPSLQMPVDEFTPRIRINAPQGKWQVFLDPFNALARLFLPFVPLSGQAHPDCRNISILHRVAEVVRKRVSAVSYRIHLSLSRRRILPWPSAYGYDLFEMRGLGRPS